MRYFNNAVDGKKKKIKNPCNTRGAIDRRRLRYDIISVILDPSSNTYRQRRFFTVTPSQGNVYSGP